MIEDIQVTFPGGKGVDATVLGRIIHTDHPKELGGEGDGPAPYDLFLASIATCAGIYALGFCQNRGIATEGLSLVQKHVVDPETHLPTSIALELTLPPGFPEKYRPAIVRAVEGCKVKKTIFSGLSFTVKET